MSEDPTLDQLDARGRAAGAALRTAVADHPAPAFDPNVLRVDLDARPVGPASGTGRRRRLGLVLAVAAAVVVVVVAVAAFAGVDLDGNDDERPADRVGAADLRRYRLAEPPGGMVLTSVYDQSGPIEGVEAKDVDGPMVVFGPSVEAPALGAVVLPSSTAHEPNEDEGFERADIGGRRAWAQTGLIDSTLVVEQPDAVDASRFVEVGERMVHVYIGATTSADLEDVVAGMRVDGDRVVVAEDALPDGWGELGEVNPESITAPMVSMGTEVDVRLWSASYGTPPGDGSWISVISRPGAALEVQVTGLVSTAARHVTVRGRPAVLVAVHLPAISEEDESLSSSTVTWEERPGEVVTVAGSVDAEALLDAAEDVVVVDIAEVEGMQAEALRFGLEAQGATPLGEGTFSDRSPWLMVLEPDFVDDETGDVFDGGVTLRTAVVPSGSSSGSAQEFEIGADGEPVPSSEPAALGEIVHEHGPDFGWLFGELAPDVASVEVRDTATGEVVAEGVVVEAEGTRAWMAEVPGGAPPESETGVTTASSPEWDVVALDASGTEVGRTSLG